MAAGDINDDGIDDLAWAETFRHGGSGLGPRWLQVDVELGPLGPTGDAAFQVGFSGEIGIADYDIALAIDGDFNGDGYHDVVIGHPEFDSGVLIEDAGRVYLFYGPFSPTYSTPIDFDEADATFTGTRDNQWVGTSIATGDFDDDGVDDLAIGARYDDTSATDAGAVYVFLGGGAFSGDYAVGGISGDHDYRFMGDENDQAGTSLAAVHQAGGYDRLIVGAPENDVNATSSGAVYVVQAPLPTTTSGLLSDTDDISDNAIYGPSFPYAYRFGQTVSSCGDCDDDDLTSDDVLVGAYSSFVGGYGAAFLYSGNEIPDPDTVGDYSDCGLFVSMDGNMSPTRPITVARGGDINGDGDDDILLGDPWADADDDDDDEGAVYVFDGPYTALGSYVYASNADTIIVGEGNGDGVGLFLTAGDINADGRSDVLTSRPQSEPFFLEGSVNAYSHALFYGPFDPLSGPIGLSSADTIFEGEDAGDRGGYSVAGVGDVNCDGVPDIAAGAQRADEYSSAAGAVYVFFGIEPGGATLEYQNAVLDMANADVVFYGDDINDYVGKDLGYAGDLDGDGCDDLLIGAEGYDTVSYTDVGAVYVFFGSTTLSGTYHQADADSTIYGEEAGDRLGVGLRGLGDLDGDGNADFGVGAWSADGAATDSGRGYVVYGNASGWSTLTRIDSVAACRLDGEASGDRAGWAWAGPVAHDGTGTDFTGNGYYDIILGAPYDDEAGTNAGAIYVIEGSSSRCSGGILLSDADAKILGEGWAGVSGYGYGGHFGHAMAGAGDLESVGADDIVVGAPYLIRAWSLGGDGVDWGIVERPDSGRAYWIPGQPVSGSVDVRSLTYDPTMMDGAESDMLGWAVAAGDVTGTVNDAGAADGVADVIVGAPYVGTNDGGAAFMFTGPTVIGATSYLQKAHANSRFLGESMYDYAGWSVAIAGDLNRAGEQDILLGAWGNDSGGSSAGAAYVVLGSQGTW